MKDLFLTLRSYYWLFLKDSEKKFIILRTLLSAPFRYLFLFFRSFFQKNRYRQEGDFYFYGVSSTTHFLEMAADPQTIVVVGFSYCEKPFECPSNRFSSSCIASKEHEVCRMCPIGKAMSLLPKKVITLAIPDVHTIARELLALQKNNPSKKILFLISSCPLSLNLFANWADVASLKGIGVALSGRTCRTFKAFQLAEGGYKPFRTFLGEETTKKYEDLLMALSSKIESCRARDDDK